MAKIPSELENYFGTNVKPDDFDLYWENALKLVESQDFNVEFVPAKTQFENVECFHLYFTGVDNSRIHCKYMKPKDGGNGKTILYFHGYTYYSGSWIEKLAYASQGYSIIAMECRGQGGTSQDFTNCQGSTIFGHIVKGLDGEKDNLYYKNVFLDTVSVAKIALSMGNTKELYTMGLSQGGGLATVCAALCPQVTKAAIQNPFLSDYQKVWELGVARNVYNIIDYFRMFDPLHEKEEETFYKLGYIDAHNFASKIKAKVLFGTGMKDDICPIQSQMAIYNNILSEKNIVLYPDFAHEDMPMFWDKTLMFFNENN